MKRGKFLQQDREEIDSIRKETSFREEEDSIRHGRQSAGVPILVIVLVGGGVCGT